MSSRVEVAAAGRAALRLRGRATVFAAFERSCYVEADGGIACLGGPRLGLGPLNACLRAPRTFAVGDSVELDFTQASTWIPARPRRRQIRDRSRSMAEWSFHLQGQAFLSWIAGDGEPDDALIGLGPGLTPAGDDFVGGAMIALRAWGHGALANRIAAWALPLARERTNRISRAHLECAAQGEGHAALHDWLDGFGDEALERLSRIGHTSGLDAAAGALGALLRVREKAVAPA